MGEFAQLQGSRSGAFGLNDFLGQLNNNVTPQRILRSILPTQEMRAFQRVYKFDSAAPMIAIGERWTVTWVIPRAEWWRVLAIQWVNGDTVSHAISVGTAIDRSDPIQTLRASQIIVDGGKAQLVYGLDNMALGGNEYFGRFPAPLQPGDILSVGDETVAVVANQPQYTLVYELVPRPAEPTTRGLSGTVDIT